MKKAFEFIKPYWRKGLVPIIYMFVATALTFLYPLFPKWAIDNIVGENLPSQLTPLIIGFIIVVILEKLFTYLNQIKFFEFQKESILGIQKNLVDKVFNYPMDFFDKTHSGYLMGRIRGDVAGLSFIFSESIVTAIMDIFKFIGTLIILLLMNTKLTLICLLIIPFLILKIISSRKKIESVNKKILAENATLEKEMSDTLQGIEVFKSYSKEEEGKERVYNALKEYQQIEVLRNEVVSKYSNYIGLIVAVGQILLLYFGIKEVLNENLTIGGYIAFIGYLVFLYAPIENLSHLLVFVDYAKRSYDRLNELLNILPEDSGNRKINGINKIVIENLHFAYTEKNEVIKDFNISLSKGDYILLSGESGSGKSTLMKLLLGLYKPTNGKIFYNDFELKELDIKNLRQQIGYISQNIFLFNRSVRDNIVFNNEGISDNQIFEILEQCKIKDKIDSLENGLDYMITEKGNNFSGGEKQRLSIARALIKRPDLIILDEGTANLDLEIEEEIEKLIFNNFKDKIIIKISHRRNSSSSKWKPVTL